MATKKRKKSRKKPPPKKKKGREYRGRERHSVEEVYCWFTPEGRLVHIFNDHAMGIKAMTEISSGYNSHAAYLQDALRLWRRHGVSPLIRWDCI